MTYAPFPSLFCGTGVSAIELREFRRLSKTVYFRTGTPIFSEHDAVDPVYGLSQGVVRLYKMLPNRRRQIVAFAMPGDFLAMPLLDRHNFSADAVGDVTLCRFSRDELTNFIRSSSNMMRLLIEFATRKLDMAQDQLLLLGIGSAEEKLTMFLINWRNELARLSKLPESLPLPMRRQDIADFLGLKLETVSRTLARLEDKKLIQLVPRGVCLTGLEQTPLATWS